MKTSTRYFEPIFRVSVWPNSSFTFGLQLGNKEDFLLGHPWGQGISSIGYLLFCYCPFSKS